MVNVGCEKGSVQGVTERRKITISDIRDRENILVPRSALKSIVDRIAQEMEQLGLKARIRTDDG